MEISKDFFEHVLNCLANQKFINEINADALECDYKKIQAEIQLEIDKTWIKGMNMLQEAPDDPRGKIPKLKWSSIA